MTDDTLDKVKELLDQGQPESWIFSENPEIVGYVLRTSTGYTEQGPCPILIVQDETGRPWSVWLFHTALRNRISDLISNNQLHVGDAIAIRHKGEVQPKSGGRAYQGYDVVTLGRAGAPLGWEEPAALPVTAADEPVDAEVVSESRPVEETRDPTGYDPASVPQQTRAPGDWS